MRAAVVASLLLMLGCEDEPPPSRATVLDASPPSSRGEVRRPEHTVYVAHEGDHCAVYWKSETAESSHERIRCPREVEPEERLRLTGRTCHRESPIAERRVPVRCHQAMFYVQDALKSREGEWYLPPDAG